MENKTLSSKDIIVNYGLILGFATVILSVITYLLNMPLEIGWISGLLGIIIMISIIVIGIKKFRANNNQSLSLGEALKIGLGIAVIGGIIASIYQLIFLTYIDPEYITRVQELQLEKALEQNPDMSDEQIEMIKKMGETTSSPWISFAGALIGNLFFGFIISLIGGLILKRDNPNKEVD